MKWVSTLLLGAMLSTSLAAAKKPPKLVRLTEQQKALHALNRLTFGPRPGDVERVMKLGVNAWIEQQLQPKNIADKALETRLAPYRAARMKPAELVRAFPPQPMIQAVAEGRRAQPTEPNERLIYAVQQARLQKQRKTATDQTPEPSEKELQEDARLLAERLLSKPRNERMATLQELPAEKLINFNNLILPDQRNRLEAEFTPAERETFRALPNPQGVVVAELQHAKILRAVLAERQLEEVMTDFWFNHFNVFLFKNAIPYYIASYERDAIRPLALGKFQDLLTEVAYSPAMLMYLDNFQSVGPNSPAGRGSRRGLNENYGRELLELHTLGVDGGYTQQDVMEVAKVFTGWTVDQPFLGGAFQFDVRRHEPGSKTVLGKTIAEAGEREGIQVLDLLSSHPSTARFICKKLAQRFLADDPPEEMVKQMAATFMKTDGDIREVLRTLFRSPEFYSSKYYRAKTKTPLEFLVSALRASGTEVTAPDPVLQTLLALGMPPYAQAVPTGYPEQTANWMTPGALLARINFVNGLSNGRFPPLRFDPARLIALGMVKTPDLTKVRTATKSRKPTGVDLAVALLEDAVFAGEMSVETDAEIRKQLQAANPPAEALKAVAALALGSPEFQRR